jgi:phosphomannomutase
MVIRTGKRPSELLEYLFSKVGAHYYDRLDVPFSGEDREKVESRVHSKKPGSLIGLKVLHRDDNDGVRYTLEDGSWLLIRFSGTEPLLRIYAESRKENHVPMLLEEGRLLAGV